MKFGLVGPGRKLTWYASADECGRVWVADSDRPILRLRVLREDGTIHFGTAEEVAPVYKAMEDAAATLER